MAFMDELRAIGRRIRRTTIPNLIRARLWEKGTYADGTPIVTYKAKEEKQEFGISLGVYSSFSSFLKAKKGQPIDRVTLKDSGTFYQSIKVSEKGITGATSRFSNNVNPKGVLDVTEEDERKIADEADIAVNKLMAKYENNLLQEPR